MLFRVSRGLGRQLVSQGLQVEQQILHDLIALLPVLAKSLADDALEFVGTSGSKRASGAGSRSRIAARTSLLLCPANGLRPATIS